MYRYPQLEIMGNAPVWSEKIVLVGWKDKNALFVFWWRVGGLIGASIVLVDRVFWYCWRRLTREVLTYGGRCFVMSLMVRPGQVEKNSAFVVLIHVVTTGLKQIRWYHIARFFLLSSVGVFTLLADCCNCFSGSLWGWGWPMDRGFFFMGQNFPVRTGLPFCE